VCQLSSATTWLLKSSHCYGPSNNFRISAVGEREREIEKRDILSANPDARALSLAKALDKRYAQMLAMGTETSCLRDTETPQLPSAIQSPQEKFATLTSETYETQLSVMYSQHKLGMPSLP
jgi:hypothetical protein